MRFKARIPGFRAATGVIGVGIAFHSLTLPARQPAAIRRGLRERSVGWSSLPWRTGALCERVSEIPVARLGCGELLVSGREVAPGICVRGLG